MEPESDLARAVRSIVEETVRAELDRFREQELVPLQAAIEEIARDRPEFELPPAAHSFSSLGSVGSQQPLCPTASPLSQNSSTPSSPNILQRVSSKVASTTSSLLFSPILGGSNSSSASGEGSGHGGGGEVGVHVGPSSSTSNLTADNGRTRAPRTSDAPSRGPVTVRRNSGLSRATNQSATLHDVHGNFEIPLGLVEGLPFLRITHNKKVQRTLKLDQEDGVISWNTKQSSRLYIDRICEIYVGEQARNYREEFRVSVEHSSRWATIIHQRRNETKLRALHLVMANQSEFDSFIDCLFRIVRYRRELMNGLAQAGRHFVDVHWTRSSTSQVNGQGSEEPKRLSFAQVMRLARQLHVNCSWHFFRQVFDEADADNSGFLNFQEFQEFVRLLKRRSDIKTVYEKHGIAESTINLVSFFEEVQKQSLPATLELPLKSPPTLEEFQQMLMPADGESGSVSETQLDLSLPLNNYFISSSHNTYLMGRQVADGSSIESCIRALQDGCRCLELDCWDGSSTAPSPVVYHGHGITRLSGSIVFSDVIDAVLKYAFISSPYPLILSLEIRCSEPSQMRIVSILRTVLAGLLVTERLPGDDDQTALPSPDALKHRILIKVKASSVLDSATSSEEGSFSSSLTGRKQKPRVIPALADLGVYLSGHHYNGAFSEHEPRNHVYSFNERTIKTMAKDELKLRSFEIHNQQYLSRVYPAPYRINSSNFDPIYFWKRGVQMVALNWQRYDTGMQINSAFFPTRVGYVLKPEFMREGREGPVQDGEPERHHSFKLDISIISAQQLPRPKFLKDSEPFSPYVGLEVLGVGPDSILTPQWRTTAVYDNGFNPIWDYHCELEIEKPDLDFACLRFSVAADNQPFAFYICRVLCMLQGYRHVPLKDHQGEEFIFSSLFIKSALTSA